MTKKTYYLPIPSPIWVLSHFGKNTFLKAQQNQSVDFSLSPHFCPLSLFGEGIDLPEREHCIMEKVLLYTRSIRCHCSSLVCIPSLA
jgi:hypothetical protein